jgi:hypothetical protein
MLAQTTSDQALEAAALEWNRYAAARWPAGPLAGDAPST